MGNKKLNKRNITIIKKQFKFTESIFGLFIFYFSLITIFIYLLYSIKFLWNMRELSDYTILKQNISYIFSNNITGLNNIKQNGEVLLENNKLIDFGIVKNKFKEKISKNKMIFTLKKYDFFNDGSETLIMNFTEEDISKDKCLVLSEKLFYIYDQFKINNNIINYKQPIEKQVINACLEHNKFDFVIFIKPQYPKINERITEKYN